VTNISRQLAGALATAILIVGCAADRLHREGLAAIDRGEYETGVADLSQAAVKDPSNMVFRLDLEARREAAVHALVAQADAARAAGQLDVAAITYRRVLTMDPSNDRALRGLTSLDADKRHAEQVAAARKDFDRKDYDAAEAKLGVVLNEDPGYHPAQELTAAINLARGPVTVAPRLKTRDDHKVTLQLRDAPTKMVFEVLQRETGINFILDKDIKSDGKTTIFVQDVPVEEAIDLVLDQNSLARQILSANMVLIYPNNSTKQKEYQEEIVRTFYVTNAAPKDVETMLKAVLGTKTLYIDDRANAVVMRDTPDVVRMAEKLVASIDVPESEVMLEVEVLEISRSRLQDLGILYPTSATLSATSVAAATTGASAGGLVLSDLAHQNSNTVTVTPLSVTLNAMKQTGLTNTLASPRIRARNKEKAKILIGQREPVITNSVTPTAAGTPVVTGNVQYLDVGLTLEVQPTIYENSDVAIKVSLEVSSLLKQITTASGTIAYEIGTRNANTLLRLRDGETQILAGLIQDSDTRTANTIPGLGDIPLLGRLFGTHHSDAEKSEIVLSITPHIIRMQPRPASDTTEFWFGTESRTRSAPYSAGSAASMPAGQASVVAGSTSMATSMRAAQSLPAPPVATPPAMAPPAMAPSAMAPPITAPVTTMPAPPVASSSALSIDGPEQTRVGEEFQVTVHLSAHDPINKLRAQLRFDPTAIQLVSATPGGIVPAAAGAPEVNMRAGGAQLEVNTPAESPVQGDGDLMVLRFKALGPRPATAIAAMLALLGGNGVAAGNTAAEPLNIVIQQ
jgi:general secretion pathway protein D